MVLYRVRPLAQNPDVLQNTRLAGKHIDAADVFMEQGFFFIVQHMHAVVNRRHKDIRRACTLKDGERGTDLAVHLLQLFTVLPQAASHMEQRCLRRAGQSLMDALNDQIGALGNCTGRERGMEAQMGSMRFVYDQQASRFMYNLCNLFDV